MSTPTLRDPVCPCGCGTVLSRYNGQRRLVCNDVWQRLPRQAVSRYMIAATQQDRRVVARAAYGLARQLRSERGGGR